MNAGIKNFLQAEVINFMAMVLFLNNWEDSDIEESDVAIYDICLSDWQTIEEFLKGFLQSLEKNHPGLNEKIRNGLCKERTFGGNVFASLTGHGIGFFDDSNPEVAQLQGILEAHTNDAYKFEFFEIVRASGDNTGDYTIEGL